MLSTSETVTERREASSQSKPISKDPGDSDTPQSQPASHSRPLGPYPGIVPPTHPHRTLVLCFDGTGDQFDADNSNIVTLVSLLQKDDRTKQLVYYQTGIGTFTSPAIVTPMLSSIRKTLDTMFGSSIHAHVMGGYEFLMQHYTTGDKICIFGFSRGAYTARSLAGMIHKVGLLPPNNAEQIPFAYKMYLRTDSIGWEQSTEFKRAFSVPVDIEFIGVWDTVDSVGLIPKRLPFTTSNTLVKTFRHAVSLDERRAKFKANLWNRPDADEEKLGQEEPAPRPAPQQPDVRAFQPRSEKKKKYPRSPPTEKINGDRRKEEEKKAIDIGYKTVDSYDELMNDFERIHSSEAERKTDIEEVWFAGCHRDIGGGSVSNKTRHSLARISLRWMIREIFKSNAGMRFISERLFEIGMHPSTLYPQVLPRPPPLPVGSNTIRKHPTKEIPIRPQALLKRATAKAVAQPPVPRPRGPAAFLGSEEEEDLNDALSPVYDRLKTRPFWWILEIIPLHLRYQKGDNTWVTYYGFNHAKPRYIPGQRTNGIKIHSSVKTRMDAEYEDEAKRSKGDKYEPRPEIRVAPTWID